MKKTLILLLALNSIWAFAQNDNRKQSEKHTMPNIGGNPEFYVCVDQEIAKKLKVKYPNVNPNVLNDDKHYNDYVESLFPIATKICENKIKSK